MGCNQTNSMVWSYDAREHLGMGLEELKELEKEEYSAVQYFRRRLIKASNLRVVLLCGRRVENMIQQGLGQMDKYSIKLHKRRYTLFVDKTDNKRIYLCCSMPPLGRRVRGSLHNGSLTDLCEIFQGLVPFPSGT